MQEEVTSILSESKLKNCSPLKSSSPSRRFIGAHSDFLVFQTEGEKERSISERGESDCCQHACVRVSPAVADLL